MKESLLFLTFILSVIIGEILLVAIFIDLINTICPVHLRKYVYIFSFIFLLIGIVVLIFNEYKNNKKN